MTLAKIKNAVRIYGTKSSGYRSIKMAYPKCEECQATDRNPGWELRCEAKGHTPYVTADHYADKVVEKTEPDGDGDLVVTETVTKKILVKGGPNLKPVPFTPRHSAQFAIQKARGEGMRMPEEIGIAPFCQYAESGGACWAQDDLVNYGDVGVYCSVEHAAAVAMDLKLLEKFGEVKDLPRKQRQTQQAHSLVRSMAS